jgi:class 3 adenylate cyclase/tetratricopeptide (TPR) repeat protein
MKCPRCQHENPAGSNFCLGCGERFSISCGSCGNELPAGSQFCNKCGAPIALESTGQSRFSSPESYTPKHLAEKILTSKAALEGERKLVTVLFADIKGSMELLADRDPEEARKLLDPVLEWMMEAVHRYEGTVNQVMGDGIMALFGAPLAHEDHAVRACYAALRMQEQVKRYAETVFRTDGVPIRIRVGLNSGEVVVRSIGSDLHMDYTAVGQTTHLAARMEQIADPGTTRLTADTLHLAEGFVQVRALGPALVKGLTAPVEVYELMGASPVRSRLQAAAARGFTKFVGRDAELDTLFATLERAKAGKGQVVAVVGEPGVGKSRLAWECTHSHRTQGCLVLDALSVSYGKATTYLPVIGLLKRYFQIEPRDDTRKIRERVAGKLLTLDESLLPLVNPVLSLLDVPVTDPAWQELDPMQQRRQILDGLRALFLRESREQPLVLFFEDLHWIDGATQALLDGLVESVPTAAILLLITYRPEYRHGWGSKIGYNHIRLDVLPAPSAVALLGDVLGADPSVGPLVPLLIARTEGNPFFLEESVRSLVETGELVGARGVYQLVRAPETLHIPATTQTILAARIDRLAPEDKRLLETAAVVGKDVPLPLLAAVAELDEAPLRAGLGRLQAAEFLYETRLVPEPEYTFKHALTHDVAYGSLLLERRRALHAQLVVVIEHVYAGRIAEHAEQLSTHATRGELWDKALAYGQQAATKAGDRSANREAVGFFERALDALAHLPPSRERQGQAIDVRLGLRRSLLPLAQFARAEKMVDEAKALAEALGDRNRLAWALAQLGELAYVRGKYVGATELLQRATTLAEELGQEAVIALTLQSLAACANAIGDFPAAIAILKRVPPSREHPFRSQAISDAYTSGLLASALRSIGDFAEASRLAREALRQGDESRHPWAQASAANAVGTLCYALGDYAGAVSVLERGLETARTEQITILVGSLSGSLGAAYLHLGRQAEGNSLTEKSLASAALHVPFRLHLRVTLGEAYLAAGCGDRARALLEEALAGSLERKERPVEAGARRLLGDVALQAEPPDMALAERHYRDALALASELGMRPLVAHCHLGLGKLYRRTGKRDQAQEHFTTAATMYREMDMRFWLEQAEAEKLV